MVKALPVTVTGLTAPRMLSIEALAIVGTRRDGDNLILIKHDGSEINLGSFRGDTGLTGNKGEPGSISSINGKTDGIIVLTAADIGAASTAAATATAKGLVELATAAEVIAGTDATRAIVPSTLVALLATTTRNGLIALASATEVAARVEATKAVTAATMIRHPGVAWARAEGKAVAPRLDQGDSQDVTVVFPSGRFSVAPNVMVSTYNTRYTPQVTDGSVTKTGFTCRVSNFSGTGGSATSFFGWSATQMTSTTGIG